MTAGRSPPTLRFASSAAAAGSPCQVLSTARAHSPQLFGRSLHDIVAQDLRDASSSDDEFRSRLEGPTYEENSDVARFVLAALSEDDALIKETWTDLWAQVTRHYVWTFEHILPQGPKLPDAWMQMLGGVDATAKA
jgi:hypothetical protein